MSSYPKQAADGGYECQACGEVWADRLEAKACCPPRRLTNAWHCGTEADLCESGLHSSEDGARRCMGPEVSDD